MQAVARAQPNIALIKYWGKRNTDLNLPAVGSISITLDALYTETAVRFEPSRQADQLTVNGEDGTPMLARISRCLDNVAGQDRPRAVVDSHSNFPLAAGLASSASAFAATTLASAAAANLKLGTAELANLAGRASGSAARSMYGGFAELSNQEDSVAVSPLCRADEWPLEVVIAVTASGEKPVGSGTAMESSRRTSPFYKRWVDDQDADLDAARAAIRARDIASLGQIAEHNCLKMHSVMWTSRPAIVYWNAATIRCMQTVRELRDQGIGVFFTIDAGPQLKAVCEPQHAIAVREALTSTAGVLSVMQSGLGEAASLVNAAAG